MVTRRFSQLHFWVPKLFLFCLVCVSAFEVGYGLPMCNNRTPISTKCPATSGNVVIACCNYTCGCCPNAPPTGCCCIPSIDGFIPVCEIKQSNNWICCSGTGQQYCDYNGPNALCLKDFGCFVNPITDTCGPGGKACYTLMHTTSESLQCQPLLVKNDFGRFDYLTFAAK